MRKTEEFVESVCMCVCVCVREREREMQSLSASVVHPYVSWLTCQPDHPSCHTAAQASVPLSQLGYFPLPDHSLLCSSFHCSNRYLPAQHTLSEQVNLFKENRCPDPCWIRELNIELTVVCITVLNKWENHFKVEFVPWLLWLSGLGAGLWTKRMSVWFPVRAHARVAGQVPSCECVRGNQSIHLSHRCFSPSLSPSLPPSLKINK